MGRPVTGQIERCFLGLALPRFIRTQLGEIRETWRNAGLKGAWAPDENFHLTARFLGDTTPEQRDTLDAILTPALAQCGAVELRLGGTGGFPNPKRPRVLWAGIETVSGQLDPLFDAAESCARQAGFDQAPRRPHPHITLMRVRRPPAARTLADFFRETEILHSDAFTVRAVALWRSTLRPGGAVYEQLKEYPLT